MEISSLIHIQLFRPESVHSGSACELVSSYSQVPTLCLDSGIVSPLWFCWFKGVCMFKHNLPPALLAKWPGSFMCHCGNKGVEWTPSKSQHTKLTQKKKILPPLLLEFKLATFWIWVQCSHQQATVTDYGNHHSQVDTQSQVWLTGWGIKQIKLKTVLRGREQASSKLCWQRWPS